MASATMVALSEYLRSSYEPDAEFVEGRIEERAMGERDHSSLQRQLLLLLSRGDCLGHLICYPELRVQTSAERFRVPDLCLLSVDAPWERVVRTAPLVCIEILSPEDTMSRTMVRVREFLAMGVREVWVFDPEARVAQVCGGTTMTEHAGGMLRVPGTPCEVSLDQVFSALPRR